MEDNMGNHQHLVRCKLQVLIRLFRKEKLVGWCFGATIPKHWEGYKGKHWLQMWINVVDPTLECWSWWESRWTAGMLQRSVEVPLFSGERRHRATHTQGDRRGSLWEMLRRVDLETQITFSEQEVANRTPRLYCQWGWWCQILESTSPPKQICPACHIRTILPSPILFLDNPPLYYNLLNIHLLPFRQRLLKFKYQAIFIEEEYVKQ